MKIITIVGARPQFIKAAAVSRVIKNNYVDKIEEVIVHTGQHYDDNMSKVFFEELDIPKPKYNLEIFGGNHGEMTGRMLEAIESVLLKEKPDWVLIYGDTNSTLAGALAASKLHIPVAHVEAGLRSFNMQMPEEINRILSDRVSMLLFCPTKTAVTNLKAEGIVNGVYNVGDVMYDVALYYKELASKKSNILNQLNLKASGYVLATCHRAENTDHPEKLKEILSALAKLAEDLPVIFPIHPRTRRLINDYGFNGHLKLINATDPLSFIDMIALEQSSRLIITDSGGVQKEAYFYGVPCLTTRNETEWVETVDSGWNQLVNANSDRIVNAYLKLKRPSLRPELYGDGQAAEHIISIFD
jgi:UDP-GlcNAc3NAcA epimerase